MEVDDEGNFDGLVAPAETDAVTETVIDEDALDAEDKEESSPSEETDGEDQPQDKKKKGVESRIDELVRDREEIRRDRDYFRDIALRAAGKDEPAPKEKEAETPPKPTQDGYDTYEEYIEALADWKAEQKLGETERRLEEKFASKRSNETREKDLSEKFDAARKRLPDFDQVLQNTRVTDEVHALVTGSEIPAEVAYYLGKNPETTKRLNALAPIDAAREIGKIEAKIQARLRDSSPPPRKPNNNPALQKPLGGGGSVSGKDPSKMTHDEFRQMRREEMKKNRR